VSESRDEVEGQKVTQESTERIRRKENMNWKTKRNMRDAVDRDAKMIIEMQALNKIGRRQKCLETED
jgi:hypothetical protein